MECSVCHAPLTNGIDTFGEIYLPMCQVCYFELRDELLFEEKRQIEDDKLIFRMMSGEFDPPHEQ